MSLAACGSDESGDETATDPTAPATDEPTSGVGNGPVDFTEVALVSGTAAGGTVAQLAVVLADRAAVNDFSEQFKQESIRTELTREVEGADVPDGQLLVASVISIGCDVPPGVSVTRTDAGLSITPLKVKNPLQECFAAVTTVALVLVDAAAL